MKNYITHHDWNIIEEGFHPKENRLYESLTSLGNGNMGGRGNFEEDYSGDYLQGTYVAGVYYPDKTRVGWWKNGYPEYFAKVPNSTNFIGISIKVDDTTLDLAKAKEIKEFKRILNMQEGYLLRSFIYVDREDKEIKVEAMRFISMAYKEIAAIRYKVTPLNFNGTVTVTPYLDGLVKNEDSNYNEYFWNEISKNATEEALDLTMETKKTAFRVSWASSYTALINDTPITLQPEPYINEKYVSSTFKVDLNQNDTLTIHKFVSVVSNRYFDNSILLDKAYDFLRDASSRGFDHLFNDHKAAWTELWKHSDIVIKGDTAAQQAIRFNIFQLNQTYTGEDPRLNIGPKGFTGEKYGGSTYWDTEAYCVPFYLSTAEESISKQLLIYRHNQLDKAKENAEKLGLKGALYPMVTMNGEECHNEWEITFEEIHRNGAIAYAIYNYVRYTQDENHLAEYGFEVLAEISRFWASRATYNPLKDKYMILGVTGPNEYENNVNNNWYTNRIASWCLKYTQEVYYLLKDKYFADFTRLTSSLHLSEDEVDSWSDIVKKMYYPVIEELGVFEQQDGYMDKEQKLVKDLEPSDLPLNQNWSWDKILRSCFIKQADVLQGLFFLGDEYDLETKKRNFDFYEPRTVHESSLSPCIYSIIAGEIGYHDKAYELYLRTARLDLDNYNNDTDDGLHITSMAGTWMSIVYGFGGMKLKGSELSFSPFIPKTWEEYSFNIMFRNRLLKVSVNKEAVKLQLIQGEDISLYVYAENINLQKDKPLELAIKG
ncbi:MAG: family 65 glycosyl hydrolase domain-containing protein [Clostridiaceae bacterium]